VTTASCIDGRKLGHRTQRGGTREPPPGSFPALQRTKAGFKPLEIAVTYDLVATFGGQLLGPPTVRRLRRDRRVIAVLDRISFRDHTLARLGRHIGGKIGRTGRFPWSGTHALILPY